MSVPPPALVHESRAQASIFCVYVSREFHIVCWLPGLPLLLYMSLGHKPASSACVYRVPYCVLCDFKCVGGSMWHGMDAEVSGPFYMGSRLVQPPPLLYITAAPGASVLACLVFLHINEFIYHINYLLYQLLVACSLSPVSSLTHQPKVFNKTGPNVGFLSPPFKTFSRVLKCYLIQAGPGSTYL